MTNNTPQQPTYGTRQTYQHDESGSRGEPAGWQADRYGYPNGAEVQVNPVQGQPVQAAYPPYAVGSPQYPVGQQAYYAAMQAGVPMQPPAQPQASQPEKEPKKKRGAGFYIALVIALIAVVAAGVLAFMWWDSQQPKGRDSNALIGQIEGKSQEEIQAELDRIIEEGMFQISIASDVTFENGTSEGALQIENVPGNRYLMQVTITRDDTGELLYESGILDPNYHIQDAPLLVDLPAGTYKATATFHALDPETEDEVGQAAAQMTIRVLS